MNSLCWCRAVSIGLVFVSGLVFVIVFVFVIVAASIVVPGRCRGIATTTMAVPGRLRRRPKNRQQTEDDESPFPHGFFRGAPND